MTATCHERMMQIMARRLNPVQTPALDHLRNKENTTMGKMTSASIKLLEAALAEWRDTCPGAGWEHHQTSALVSLAMTPGMQQLLELAAVGIAVKEAEDQRHIRT